MFLKRLSTAFCTLMLSGVVLGATFNSQPNTVNTNNGNALLAPLDLSFILTPVAPRCTGENNGKIDVQVITGTGSAPYKYQLQKDGGTIQPIVLNQPASFTISGLSSGTYKIYLTDNNNFTATQETKIVDNPALSLNLENSVVSPLCSGGTANILLQASGGSGSGYIYNLYNNGTSAGQNNNGDFLNQGDGNYSATVTDVGGCIKNYVGTIQVAVPVLIDSKFTILSEINCDNGYASVKFYNLPIDPFQIEVKNTTLNKTYTSHTEDYIFNNLEAGTYNVTVTRVSCSTDKQSLSFIIAPFAPITVSTTPNSPVVLNCGGINDLTDVGITINGGKTGNQVRVVMDNNDGVSNDNEYTGFYNSVFNFSGLLAGNYTIRWNDVNNPTCSGSQSYVISNPASPFVWVNDPVGVATKCYGDATGVIQINFSGGTKPYSYFIDGASVTLPINNRSAGSYAVYGQDSKGCITEERTVTITQPDAVVVTHNPVDDVDVLCPNGSTGEIHLTISGGVGNFKYDLASSSNPSLRTNMSTTPSSVIGALSGDIYSVTVKDANNCSATSITGIEISEPDPISISMFDLDTIQCFGETTALNVQAIGGADPTMNYKLVKGRDEIGFIQTTGVASFTDLVPSSDYNLIITSGTLCTDRLDSYFSVVDRRKLIVENLSDSIMLRCSGDVPTVTLKIKQGEAPYQYSIDGGVIYNDFAGNIATISSGLTASISGFSNRIIVKDKYNCETSVDISIYEPEALTYSGLDPRNETCREKNNGEISFQVSGGTPTYTATFYNVTDNITQQIFTSISGNFNITDVNAEKNYLIKINDNKGCSVEIPETSIEIDQPIMEYTLAPLLFPDILCYGGNTVVKIATNGGWDYSSSTINIKGGSVNETINAGDEITLSGGTYTLTAINSDGCTATQMLPISQPGKLDLWLPVPSTNVTCNGFDDATISLSAKGGTQPYSYGLSGSGSADQSFIGTSYTISGGINANVYQLIVKDANNCESNIIPVTITEPPIVTFDVKPDSVTCFGLNTGRITIQNASGGNDNGYRTYVNSTEKIFPTVSGLTAGSYDVYITDSKGCTAANQVVAIGQPDAITLNGAFISDNLLCYGDQNASITIDATGGLPYNLQYKITGRSYQPVNVFSNLPFGEYEVFVRNSKGNCEIKLPGDKIKILNPEQISVTKIDTVHVTCHNLENGEATIFGVGGTGTLNYFLTNAPPTIADNPNNSGYFRNLGEQNKTYTTYTYRIEDSNLCKKTGSFIIKNPDELLISEIDHHQVTCNNYGDGWIKLKVSGGNGGYSFYKNVGFPKTNDVEVGTSNEFTLTKFVGGTFTPVVTDSKNCSQTLSLPVEIIDPAKILIESVDWGIKLCNGDMDDATTIHVSGGTPGFYYSLDNGTTYSTLNDSVFVGEAIGNKMPVVKDKFNCKTPVFESFFMSQPDLLSVEYEFFPIRCFDDKFGDMRLDISGGTGPYTLGINDPSFTSSILSINKALTDITTVKLLDENVELVPEIMYSFYLKDANGCHIQNISGINDATDVFTDTIFKIPPKLVLEDLNPIGVRCDNETTGVIEFTASGGTTTAASGYVLTTYFKERNITKRNAPGFDYVSDLFAGAYECRLTDANGCIGETRLSPAYDYDTTTIDAENTAIRLSISEISLPTCDRIYDGWIDIDIEDFYEKGVTYTVEIWDSVTGRFVMDQPEWTDSLKADSNYSNQVEDHELYYLNSVRVVENIGIGTYRITIKDNQSLCETFVDTLILSTDGGDCPPISYFDVFSPGNGDDYFNEWNIYHSQFQNYTLQVFTGWGDLVYSKKSRSDGEGIKWDGIDNKNRPVPAGTYIYLLRKNEGTPKDTIIPGNITILRGNGR